MKKKMKKIWRSYCFYFRYAQRLFIFRKKMKEFIPFLAVPLGSEGTKQNMLFLSFFFFGYQRHLWAQNRNALKLSFNTFFRINFLVFKFYHFWFVRSFFLFFSVCAMPLCIIPFRFAQSSINMIEWDRNEKKEKKNEMHTPKTTKLMICILRTFTMNRPNEEINRKIMSDCLPISFTISSVFFFVVHSFLWLSSFYFNFWFCFF